MENKLMAVKTKKKEEVKETATQDAPLTSFIETDCVGVDLAISNGKGIPVGGNILIYGEPGAGKSTLIADILRRIFIKYEAMGKPFRALYIDSENSLSLLNCMGKRSLNDPNDLGLQKYITVAHLGKPFEYKPQQLIYYPNIHSFTEIEEIYDLYLNNATEKEHKDVKIFVVDSLTNLVSTTLQEAAVDKADFGSNARERNRFYGKWLWQTRQQGVITIYTSQMRQKQNATAYENPLKAAVTPADKHNMDVIMQLSKITDSKRVALKKIKQKTIDGVVDVLPRYILKLSTKKTGATKNRIWDAVDVEILVKPGSRVLNSYTVFNMLEENGFYKAQKAGIYTVDSAFKEAVPSIDFKDADGTVSKKDLNAITSVNLKMLEEFLKLNNMYKATIGEIEEPDDGLSE